jgi:hypothetical protein
LKGDIVVDFAVSKKVAVVIRQMPDMRPVTSKVIGIPDDIKKEDLDDFEGYLKDRARDHIESFIKRFVEFREAKFYIDIVELDK